MIRNFEWTISQANFCFNFNTSDFVLFLVAAENSDVNNSSIGGNIWD